MLIICCLIAVVEIVQKLRSLALERVKIRIRVC